MTDIMVDQTHDPALTSWVTSAQGHSDFPIQNLPLGIFSPGGGSPRIGVAIGDDIVDLSAIAALLPTAVQAAIKGATLNALFALPADARRSLRQCLSHLLSREACREQVETAIFAAQQCRMRMPAAVGDYTDFYVGIHHATNIGKLFRPDNPLLPNYKHVPIGYHGRASSLRPTGEPVRRPMGQTKAADASAPTFGPSKRLDFELELGVWIGEGNMLGTPIPIDRATDHVAGYCLLNDWSARDFQAWEYVPLGPFLAKNFHSTISPWVVTAEAMAPFRVAQPARPAGDPTALPYLMDERDQASGALSVDLTVRLTTAAMRAQNMPPYQLSRSSALNMYWTIAQIVTHHTSNGCNLQPGDLLGTGTISGPTPDSYGSLMEITQGGSSPILLPTGERRIFVEDGDEIILAAHATAPGRVPIGFGACRAIVAPAKGAD